jgi:hypothetical protein
MPEPVHLSGPAGFNIFGGLSLLCGGIFLITNEVPSEDCVGGNMVNDADHDDVNKWALYGGACALGAGLLALIAGIIGCNGACHQFQRSYARGGANRQHCLTIVAAVLSFFALLITLAGIGLIAAGFGIAEGICEDALCAGNLCSVGCLAVNSTTVGSTEIFYNGGVAAPVVVVGNVTVIGPGCKNYCRNDHDAFCRYALKSKIAFAFAMLALVVMIIVAILGICCRGKFNFPEKPPPERAQGVVPSEQKSPRPQRVPEDEENPRRA